MNDLSLAADFPAATREAWLALVERVLKGANFEDKLVARTFDGIRVEPLYAKADNPARPLRTDGGRWRIAQRVDHPDPKAANDLALLDLEGGADALCLVFREAAAARGFGLAARTVEELDDTLHNVQLDFVQLRLEAGGFAHEPAALLVALAERRGHALRDLDFDLGLDPIGAMAGSGKFSASWDGLARRCAKIVSELQARGLHGPAFRIDARPYHEAGASEGQELAAALATGLAYLRALERNGHSLEASREALSFLLVADADEFLTVAKFRALRRLWARVEDACGLAPKPMRLHAETAWRMTTRRDPWINILRATVAVFSAGIGGADGITALPFTAALGLPDAFARRIARNTQLILLDEAHLWRVHDPVAGAGAFEALTDALCERAWSLFQDIEREGGIVASLESGALQPRIAAVRAERERAVATRRDSITGTSEFPDLRETAVKVLLPSPRREGAELGPLPSLRLSEPFERLRDASDAEVARTGVRPRVFLANLGPASAFAERATFAKNFFAAGGIEAVGEAELSSPEDVAAAFAASGAPLACLCSSDDIYARLAAPCARTLQEMGVHGLYLVGHPEHFAEHLGTVRVTTYLFAGCDAVAILGDALEQAGSAASDPPGRHDRTRPLDF